VNIARKHLAPPGPLLRRLTGRPVADDPFWQFRRSRRSGRGHRFRQHIGRSHCCLVSQAACLR
jgi:hypothetical protein